MAKKEMIKEKKTICSMIEFRKRYLPKSFEKQISEETRESRDLGIIWAKESIEKIKGQLKD